MCRDKDHAGNRTHVRCACDTSAARQARRERSRLRQQFGAAASGGAVVNYTPNAAASAIDFDAAPAQTVVPQPQPREVALAAARAALDAYQKVAGELAIPAEAPRHDVPLTDQQVAAEAQLIRLGLAVEVLAATHGAPEDQEWEIAKAKWQAGHELRMAELEEAKAKINALKAAYNRAPLRPTNESFASRAEALKAYNDHVPVHNAKVREIDRADQPHADPAFVGLIQRRAQAYRAALQELGVEFASGQNLTYTIDKPRPKLEGNLRSATEYYPDAWVTKAQLRDAVENRTLHAYQQGSRAHYEPSGNRIRLSAAEERVLVHELGHYLEGGNRDLGEAERAFLSRRSGLLEHHRNPGSRKPLQQVFSRGEAGYRDGFAHQYSGKIYPHSTKDLRANGCYEVLTTGMEITFFGRLGAGVGAGTFKEDREHVAFTLGLLASSARGGGHDE